MSEKQDVISGKIIKIRYSKGAWAACVVELNNGSTIACSGTMPGIFEGMQIKAFGRHTVHLQYGPQFEVERSELNVGRSKEDALRYLSSGAVKGVGPVVAQKIVDCFGDKTMEIIENDWIRLTEIDGIGKTRAENIHKADAEANVYKKLLGYANLTMHKAEQLYNAYQEKAVEIIEKTPYQIIHDISGFGFKTVDAIALKNGHSESSPQRIAAAITFALTEIGSEGHCYCSIHELESFLNDLIPSVDNEAKSQILLEEIQNGRVILEDEGFVYAKRMYEAETQTAKRVVEMLKSKNFRVPKSYIEDAIAETEAENGFELETHQKEAVSVALQNQISIVTGGPGTGKSTIVKAIVKGWMKCFPEGSASEDHVVMCAPTGKAARRMSEVTGVFAETVQRILARQRGEGAETIENKLIIIDESSMIDISLASSIMAMASKGNNRIVFIGDINQLPPIGPGNFFRDLVNSPCVPSVTLRLCHRQFGTIALNAKKINDGDSFSSLNFNDESMQFKFAEKSDARAVVIDEYMKLLNKYGMKDVCVVVPIRKSGRSQTSADDLNVCIREKINPATPTNTVNGVKFRVGDRVMNTTNDYEREIFNGDSGVIKDIDIENSTIIVETDDNRLVEFSFRQAESLVLAYAITTHKSQGSEFKGVVIAHNKEHYFILQRNLLYTAVTRAKKSVTLVGEPAAINIAIKKVPSQERKTKLRLRIGNEIAK